MDRIVFNVLVSLMSPPFTSTASDSILSIRPETVDDIDAVTQMTTAAFLDHPYSRQTEAAIIFGLRASGALAVSLVAELSGGIVGHIAFSPIRLSGEASNWFGLGPVAVIPSLQRIGIGSALIHAGLATLRFRNAGGCVLVGDLGYYRRFGFVQAQGLVLPGVPSEYFLALPFAIGPIVGEVSFHPAFDNDAPAAG